MTKQTFTYYVIKVGIYGNFVRTDGHNGYRGQTKTPDFIATRAVAQAVIRHYKQISKNSGKAPSPMEIVRVDIEL